MEDTNMRGRYPSGPEYVEQLPGSAEAKRRLQVVLQTMSGAYRVQEACTLLGISRQRFEQLRTKVLRAALTELEPKPGGRPPAEPSVGAAVTALETKLAETERELRAARLRERIARVLPRASQPLAEPGQPDGAKKKTAQRPGRGPGRGGGRSAGVDRDRDSDTSSSRCIPDGGDRGRDSDASSSRCIPTCGERRGGPGRCCGRDLPPGPGRGRSGASRPAGALAGGARRCPETSAATWPGRTTATPSVGERSASASGGFCPGAPGRRQQSGSGGSAPERLPAHPAELGCPLSGATAGPGAAGPAGAAARARHSSGGPGLPPRGGSADQRGRLATAVRHLRPRRVGGVAGALSPGVAGALSR